jgi:hypothetical protein
MSRRTRTIKRIGIAVVVLGSWAVLFQVALEVGPFVVGLTGKSFRPSGSRFERFAPTAVRVHSSPEVDALLRYVRVDITSHSSGSCERLRQTVGTVLAWRPVLDRLLISVHTNNVASRVKCLGDTLPLDQVEFTEHPALLLPFVLAHRYKPYWELAAQSPDPPTTFVYLEDDMILTAAALVAWARDTVLLRASNLTDAGFMRSFLRYEVGPDAARVFVDLNYNLRTPRLCVRSTDAAIEVLAAAERVVDIHGTLFYAPLNPYCAVSVLSFVQAQRWMSNPLWGATYHSSYKQREFAACGVHYSYENSATEEARALGWNLDEFRVLVPLELRTDIVGTKERACLRFDEDAMIHHAPNKYVNIASSQFSTVDVDHFWLPQIDEEVTAPSACKVPRSAHAA